MQKIVELAHKHPGLQLLLLFGSRAQGKAREDSDWDFGYLADPNFDSLAFYTDLVLLLETDRVDLVDLERASGLLRFRAIRDGILLFEAQKGQYQKFWLEVVDFWCENGPIFQREYEAILEDLG